MKVKEYPYWWDTVPALRAGSGQPETPIQNRDVAGRTWDVAIVGAGYTGLAAALRLARTGASVVVLERERAGWGASSRNGGQVLTGAKLDPAVLIARFGETRARELFGIHLDSIAELEALIAGEGIACDYERTGHIQAAWKPAHFETFREEQALLARVFRHRVDLVPRSSQRAELDTDLYHGLLVDERSGAINPAKYAVGLAASACHAGAVITSGVPVARMARSPRGWKIATGAGDVDASDVLIATDGYTDAAAPQLQRRLVPIGSYIVATEPLDAADAARLIPRRRVAFDSKHFLYYFRVTPDRRLLFGGRAEFSKPTTESVRRAAAILHDALTSIFPSLASAPVEYAWGGNVAFTRDQMPRAGRLDGAYFAGGYCGHGIAMATYLGTLIGRRIAGERIDHPLMDDRFAAIPLYRGHAWFLPLVGAYYRLRDLVD